MQLSRSSTAAAILPSGSQPTYFPSVPSRARRLSKLDEDDEAGQGDDFYRVNGAGEMLVFSAADFETFFKCVLICSP